MSDLQAQFTRRSAMTATIAVAGTGMLAAAIPGAFDAWMTLLHDHGTWPVADVLAEHPAVREAAVVGVPDEVRGETVRAFVSLMPGADASPEDLIAHCRERMAAYKYPRDVRIVEELPKTVTGKILRRELRDA